MQGIEPRPTSIRHIFYESLKSENMAVHCTVYKDLNRRVKGSNITGKNYLNGILPLSAGQVVFNLFLLHHNWYIWKFMFLIVKWFSKEEDLVEHTSFKLTSESQHLPVLSVNTTVRLDENQKLGPPVLRVRWAFLDTHQSKAGGRQREAPQSITPFLFGAEIGQCHSRHMLITALIIYPKALIIYPKTLIIHPKALIIYPKTLIIYPKDRFPKRQQSNLWRAPIYSC